MRGSAAVHNYTGRIARRLQYAGVNLQEVTPEALRLQPAAPSLSLGLSVATTTTVTAGRVGRGGLTLERGVLVISAGGRVAPTGR